MKPPMEGIIRENKLVNKRKGLLRYMDNGIGLNKKPCATSLNEVKGPCCVREDMEESLHDGNLSSSASLGKDANQILENPQVVSAVEPALDALESSGCCEELMDQQEVKPSDSPVSGEDGCRSLAHCAIQSLEVPGSGEDPEDQQGVISGSKHFLHCSNRSLEVPGSGGYDEDPKDQQGVLSGSKSILFIALIFAEYTRAYEHSLVNLCFIVCVVAIAFGRCGVQYQFEGHRCG